MFRAFPQGHGDRAVYFVQHIRVPVIEEDAKGEASLDGGIDLGEGQYHVDWLMRDRAERLCSSSWDVEATLPPKDKGMPLFLKPNEIAQSVAEPFVNDGPAHPRHDPEANLNVKLLVNFAPPNALSSALDRNDTDALVSILKAVERDPHVGRVSLVAFNVGETRVLYRQQPEERIDFPALGKALQSMQLGTVNIQKLEQKHSETDFLEDLIEKEVNSATHPDAVVFAGPKAMLHQPGDSGVSRDRVHHFAAAGFVVFDDGDGEPDCAVETRTGGGAGGERANGAVGHEDPSLTVGVLFAYTRGIRGER